MALVKSTVSLLLIFCIACLLACSRRHSDDEHYYLVTANKSIPYWQNAASGFFEGAKQMNVRAEVVGPDTYDAANERDEFHALLAKNPKPAGILVSPADPEILKPEIDAAIAAGIPVITIDTDSPNSTRLFFIGTYNYRAGQLGGQVMAKQLNGKGNVVVYTLGSQVNTEERMHGYRDVFEKYPGIKIAQVIDIKGDPRIAFDQTQTMIDKKADVDGFVCLEAQAGKEVATVLDNNHLSGKKVIVAMDTDDKTLDWIKKGVIAATVAQKPYTMGYVGVKMVDDYHHSQADIEKMASTKSPNSPLPAYVDTGATLVDKNNVDEIIQAVQSQSTKK
ncbi:MAG TPA: substrate-binding domain-containing protein [Terriglobales bacterium]|nr:substrate-binding domain-containing protein [Terriglobales bacterium]